MRFFRPRRPHLTFGIPLRASLDPEEWRGLCVLIGNTLRSVYNQTDPSFAVIIACDRPPELDFAPDRRLTILAAPSRPPSSLREGDNDAGAKRWEIAAHFVRGGGGYLMFLDADDWVSNRLVDHVRRTRHPVGYVLEDGYACDLASRKVMPIPTPGIADARFDLSCGSSIILRLDQSDFTPDANGERRFSRLYRLGHTSVRDAALAEGRPLQKLPFRGAVYVFNTGLSLSEMRGREEPDFAAGRANWSRVFAERGADLAGIAQEFGQAGDGPGAR
ncbi:MAG TPA: glycosyltransferase family A protein [Bauldia sp.]|nr:glycosyltransferase family A protein [Bauldia sp.]